MPDGNMSVDTSGGSTPRPDPTLLTTEALNREVEQLQTQIDGRFHQLMRELELLELSIERRLASAKELGADRLEMVQVQLNDLKVLRTSEIEAIQTELKRVEELVDVKHGAITEDIIHLERLRDQKFAGVAQTFELMEQHRVEQKRDTQAAVDAALAAAKEAVNAQTIASDRSIMKSETATSEQLKQMNVTTSTAISGINLIIDDVKERINRIETLRVGGQEMRVSSAQTWGYVVGAVGILSVIVTIFLEMMNRSN